MFRQASKVALVVLVAVGGVAVATAAEPKPDTTKQITNSIGMKLIKAAATPWAAASP